MSKKNSKAGRPKGSKNKKKRVTDIVKQETSPGKKVLPYSKTLEPLRYTIKYVLQGYNSDQIKAMLKGDGYDVSLHSTYRLIRIAKKKILKRAEEDLNINYQMIEENLKSLHHKCIEEDDKHLQLKVLDKLMSLYGLDKVRVEQVTMNVTPEDIDDFKKTIFG